MFGFPVFMSYRTQLDKYVEEFECLIEVSTSTIVEC